MMSIFPTYFGYEDEAEEGGVSQEHHDPQNSVIDDHVRLEQHSGSSQHDGENHDPVHGDADQSGVVQVANLHLPCLKGEEDADDQQDTLVHKQDAEPDEPASGLAQADDC